jgi:predicted TIM-barrel enzyme
MMPSSATCAKAKPSTRTKSSDAASLLRFRRAIGAERVQVWADVKKKHSSHAITADVDVGDTAAATEFMRADAVIVTGAATGEEPDDVALTAVRQRSRLPLYIGSGLTADNLSRFAPLADGFIVGSYFKQAGRWSETVDPRRVERFMSLHGPAIASLHDEPHRARHLRSSG